MQDDILIPDSSWAERSKKGVGKHRSAEEHTQYSLSDKFAQADAERRADETQKREHIANDAETRHGEHRSSKRTHSKHLGDKETHVKDRDDERHGRDKDGQRRDVDRDRSDGLEERHRRSRHDQHKQKRHHSEHDSTSRHDKDIQHDRKRHHSEHETRSRHDREGKHEREWRRSEHDCGGRHDRHERRERNELHNRSLQDERSTEQRHSTDDRGREQRHSSARISPNRQDAVRNRKESKVDFEKLIPGYAKMTPAERMKARTKLLLDKSSKQVFSSSFSSCAGDEHDTAGNLRPRVPFWGLLQQARTGTKNFILFCRTAEMQEMDNGPALSLTRYFFCGIADLSS